MSGTQRATVIIALGAGAILAVVAVVSVLLSLEGGTTSLALPDRSATPEASPSIITITVTPTPDPAAACALPEADICATAAAVEEAIAGGDVAAITARSGFDVPSAQAGIASQLDRTGATRVAAIGCPAADGFGGCEDVFLLAVVATPYGERPGDTDEMVVLGYRRHSAEHHRLILYHTYPLASAWAGIAYGGLVADPHLWDALEDHPQTRFVPFDSAGRPPLDPFPVEVNGVAVTSFAVVEPVPLPEDGAVTIQTGCYGCDGPTASLERLYRDDTGELRREVLFEGPPSPDYISSYDAAPGGYRIVVSTCTGYCGGLGPESPDARTTFFRSLDGGITWDEMASVDGSARIAWSGPGDDDMTIWWDRGTDLNSWDYEAFAYPSLAPLEGLAGARTRFVLADGTPLFEDEAGVRLLREDGSVFLDPGLASFAHPHSGLSFQVDPTGRTVVVGFSVAGPATPAETETRSYSAVFRDGRLVSVFDRRVGLTAWLTDMLALGNVGDDGTVPLGLDTLGPGPSNIPVVVDLSAGTLSLLEPGHFFGDPPQAGRERIAAHLPGPLVRAVPGNGDCLNIREEPGAASPSIVCVADGVLLATTGRVEDASGDEWLQVTAPDGRAGWVSTEYSAW